MTTNKALLEIKILPTAAPSAGRLYPLDAYPLDAYLLDAYLLDAFALDAFALDAFALDALLDALRDGNFALSSSHQ